MKALRRVTKEDIHDSNFLADAMVQTWMAKEAGEISTDVAQGLIKVFYRMHTGVMVRSGIIARRKQARFNERAKGISPIKQMDIILAGLLLGLVIAWIWLI